MSKQKGKQVQSEIGDRVFNILSGLFATASIAFSERYNAQYGILEVRGQVVWEDFLIQARI